MTQVGFAARLAFPHPFSGEWVEAASPLPPDLAEKSLHAGSIILLLDDAIQAVSKAAEQGVRIENWEGWIRLHDGSRVRSLEHGGSFALARDPARAAQQATEAMRHAQARFEREPEYPDSLIYFRLTFAAT